MNTYFEPEDTLRWMKGNTSAVEYIEMMCNVAHTWDDLIDRDTVIRDEDINKVFFDMLIRLPRNDFYRKHFEHLNSVLVNALSNWMVATKMEREGGPYEASIAFVLRSSYVDLITQAALLLGGQQWACKVGEEVRLMTHGETFEGYLENLKRETDARKETAGHPETNQPEPGSCVKRTGLR